MGRPTHPKLQKVPNGELSATHQYLAATHLAPEDREKLDVDQVRRDQCLPPNALASEIAGFGVIREGVDQDTRINDDHDQPGSR